MKALKYPDWKPVEDLAKIAKKWAPTIVCDVKSVSDYLGRIPEDLDSNSYEHRGNVKPTAYYSIRCDNEFMYIIYAFYHFWDKASRHKHDFEGVMLCVDKAEIFGVVNCGASIHHHEIKFTRAFMINALNDYFGVEAGGHGIEWNSGILRKPKNVMIYRNFNLESMDEWEPEYRKLVHEAFSPSVKLPDEWVDMELETYVNGVKPVILGERLTTTRGLFINRPDILIELAKTRGKL